MKKIIVLVLSIISSNSFALDDFIPVDLVGNYDEGAIYAKVNASGNIAMLEIENMSGDVMACEGIFHSGPEPDVRRRVVLNSGAERMLSAKFHRHVIRLKVEVNCEKKS